MPTSEATIDAAKTLRITQPIVTGSVDNNNLAVIANPPKSDANKVSLIPEGKSLGSIGAAITLKF
jgi:hypothetical protein